MIRIYPYNGLIFYCATFDLCLLFRGWVFKDYYSLFSKVKCNVRDEFYFLNSEKWKCFFVVPSYVVFFVVLKDNNMKYHWSSELVLCGFFGNTKKKIYWRYVSDNIKKCFWNIKLFIYRSFFAIFASFFIIHIQFRGRNRKLCLRLHYNDTVGF